MWGTKPPHSKHIPSEFQLWELKSRWIPKFLEDNFKDQNSLDWRVHYTIEKFLKHMSKIGLHNPFGYLKHKL